MLAAHVGTLLGDTAAAVPAVMFQSPDSSWLCLSLDGDFEPCLSAVRVSLSWAGQLINAH